ncbi:hypothetical protein F4803DRAFT_513350 [Xylaria telfairii]|nr:hypothetical protein F4803DRAFT_513350 [Xylaria telfairii]
MPGRGGPAPNAAADGELQVTAQESKLFTHIVKQLPKAIDIDWDQLAKELGFKNAEVAKTRCRQIRTKLGIYGPPGSSSQTSKSAVKGPSNEKNKVTKPRKLAKTKKAKHVPEAEDDAKDEDMASDAEDSEI